MYDNLSDHHFLHPDDHPWSDRIDSQYNHQHQGDNTGHRDMVGKMWKQFSWFWSWLGVFQKAALKDLNLPTCFHIFSTYDVLNCPALESVEGGWRFPFSVFHFSDPRDFSGRSVLASSVATIAEAQHQQGKCWKSSENREEILGSRSGCGLQQRWICGVAVV